MDNIFYDFDNDDIGLPISDDLAINSKGELIKRMDKHVAWNLDTGKMSFISEWSKDDKKDKNGSKKKR